MKTLRRPTNIELIKGSLENTELLNHIEVRFTYGDIICSNVALLTVENYKYYRKYIELLQKGFDMDEIDELIDLKEEAISKENMIEDAMDEND